MLSLKKFIIPLSVIAALITVFILINQLGFFSLLAKLNEPQIGLPLIFLIGILAGFHCVGMCGGLVVAVNLKKGDKDSDCAKMNFWPQVQYNFGRLISYSAIGAILGGFGTFFAINPSFNGFVLLVAAFFMVIFGLSLITEFKWLKRIRLSAPLIIARHLYANKDKKRPKGPFLIGLLNGFMPCGPLQAVQLYALTSGSAITGALSLGAYALGTIPVMFGLGLIVSRFNAANVSKMMKYSGAVVLILGLAMFYRGLGNFGFNPRPTSGNVQIENGQNTVKPQEISMTVGYYGYQPNVLYARAGVPVRWIIDGSGVSGCTNEIILHGYDIRQKLTKGTNIIEFTPREPGEIRFSCWMQMVWGKFIIE